MNELLGGLNHLAYSWGHAMWRANWEGGLVALGVWGLCSLTPRLSPSPRCWLWRATLAKFVVALLVPPFAVRLAGSVATTALAGTARAVQSCITWPVPVLPTTAIALRVSGATGTANPHVSPMTVAMLLWLGLVVGGLGRAVAAWFSARSLRAACIASGHPAAAAPGQIPRGVRVVVSEVVSQPLLIGIRHPVVVLPQTMLALDPDDVGLVVRHELEHVNRRDLLWNWLPTVALALCPVNPIVWLAGRELRLSQEIACDEAALLGPDAPRIRYANVLIRVAELAAGGDKAAVGALAMGSPHRCMKRRLSEVLNDSRASRRPTALAAAALAIAVTAVLPVRFAAPYHAASAATVAVDSAKSESIVVDGKSGLVLGTSTMDDVRRILGAPESMTAPDGEDHPLRVMWYPSPGFSTAFMSGRLAVVSAWTPAFSYMGLTVGATPGEVYAAVGAPKGTAHGLVDGVTGSVDYDVAPGGSGTLYEVRSKDYLTLSYTPAGQHVRFHFRDGKVWVIDREAAALPQWEYR